jgi:H+/gluconate symporter-like permease
MKELLDKISSYNIFNFLLPGILFSVLTTKICGINLIHEDLFIGAFEYYFIGLVISRFGSLIIEPILKKTSFVKFADYSDFITASSQDSKIEVLSETNNMLRTIISMLFLVLLIICYQLLAKHWEFLKNNENILLLTLLLIMFLFAYRKQTNYITKRIKAKK